MLRLLIDENIDHRILRGLKSRLPKLDLVLATQAGLARSEDLLLLRWAVEKQRIIITPDLKTMVPYANQLLQRSEPMAGVIAVPEDLAIGRAIEDLELLIVCCSHSELKNTIEYLPLRVS